MHIHCYICFADSIFFQVRCIYRIAEFAEGMDGYAFRKEWLFWVFETIPMIFAIGVFCIYHPARYLNPSIMKLPSKKSKNSTELSSMAPGSQQEMV